MPAGQPVQPLDTVRPADLEADIARGDLIGRVPPDLADLRDQAVATHSRVLG